MRSAGNRGIATGRPRVAAGAAHGDRSDVKAGRKAGKKRQWQGWVLCLVAAAFAQVCFIASFWSNASFRDPEQRAPAELANLTAFADPDSMYEGLKTRPNDIALLLLASGRRADLLRLCLEALFKVEGFDPTVALVAQAESGGESEQVARDTYGLAWLGPGGAELGGAMHDVDSDDALRWPATAHYRQALTYAVNKHFVSGQLRSIFVFTEDMALSPDLLWYLAQLEGVLRADATLGCVSAFNDNGLAPYIADVTTLLRSDWFSGIAWMVMLDILRNDILPRWPRTGNWRSWMRSRFAAGHLQCIIPEVSRVAFSTAFCASLSTGKVKAQDEFCDDDIAAAQYVSIRSVATDSLGVNLGDVMRMTSARYSELFTDRWPARQGFSHALPVQSISELEVRLDTHPHRAIERHKVLPHHPLRLVFARTEVEQETGKVSDSWEHIAQFFGLPHGGPRATYNGVARIWWRDCVLYLAALASPLLAELGDNVGTVLHGADFANRAKHRMLPEPLPVPPHSFLSAAPVGVSCTQFCQTQGRYCLDADLAAINSCSPPLTSLFECKSCLGNAAVGATVYPGLNGRNDQCVAGTPQAVLNGVSGGDCNADEAAVRRACVCRERSKHIHTKLFSVGSRVLRASPSSGAPAHREAKQGEIKGTMLQDKGTAERSDVPALERFAARAARGVSPDIPPSEIPVLVVAAAAKRDVRRDLSKLRATLTSLLAAQRVRLDQVLVAHDEAANLVTTHLIEREFSLRHLLVNASAGGAADTSSVVTRLYHRALMAALEGPFRGKHALVVLEEGLEVAPDFLWFFAQLQSLLDRDETLWCVSAWNENGLAPFVADPTVVTRTDNFMGVAWLALVDKLWQLLPQWPDTDWEGWMQKLAHRHQMQCLMPEVSRVAHAPVVPPRSDKKHQHQRGAGIHGSSPDGVARKLGVLLCDQPWVHLGNVERLNDRNYRQLFYEAWPGEGLVNSQLVSSVRDLIRKLDQDDGTPLRIIFQNTDPEADKSWSAVAQFFGLRRSVPIPGSYYGVVRLRWRFSPLYLVASSSPFAKSSMGVKPPEDMQASEAAFLAGIGPAKASDILLPTAFASVTPPVLASLNTKLVLSAAPGLSCDEACASYAMVCRPADLFFLNTCGSLSKVLTCKKCKAGEGECLPSATGLQKDEAGEHAENCYYNSNWVMYPPTCSTRDDAVQRLCACRTGAQVSREVSNVNKEGPGSEASQTAAPGRAGRLRGGTQRGNRAPSGDHGGATAGRSEEGSSRPRDAVEIPMDLHQAPLPAFATSLEVQPKDLAILILTTGTRSAANALRRTLHSMARLPGLNPWRVLVSQAGLGDAVKRVAMSEFKTSWVQYKVPDERLNSATFTERISAHWHSAITHALQEHFVGSRSLVVLEGDVLVTADFLWYFSQLEPLMHTDQSIWCVSAWSDTGLSPYVTDPSALGLTDVFSGIAWMLPTAVWMKELLSRPPGLVWEAYVQEAMQQTGRHCIVPEMPRAIHAGVASESENQDARSAERAVRDVGAYNVKPGSVHEVLAVDFRESLLTLQKDHFERPLGEALIASTLLEGLEEVPVPYDDDGHPASGSWRLHCTSEEQWSGLARFFYLPTALPPRGSYRGVVRLRWGSGWFFLITADSSLAVELGLATPTQPLSLPTKTWRPLLVVGGASVVPASEIELGKSCDSVCAARELQCLSSDLVFINSCDALRKYHHCERCAASSGSGQLGLQVVGHNRQGTCSYGSDLANSPPLCDASSSDVRRLCVCRPAAQGVQSAAVQTLGSMHPTATEQAKEHRSAGSEAKTRAAESPPPPGMLTKAFGTDVAAFSDPTAPIGLLETPPAQLPILLVVLDARLSTLKATLDGLMSATRFNPASVLVSFSDATADVSMQRYVSNELKLGTVMHKVLDVVQSMAPHELESMHYHKALEYALKGPFHSNRSIIVLDSMAIVSPDFLWYFAQLEPLLHADTSLWCITAWNENGLAPYVADPTALLRGDTHPAVAFMLRTSTFWQDLRPTWPTIRLEDFLNDDSVRKQRQCIYPELSRIKRQPMDQWTRTDRARFDEHILPVASNEHLERIHLGDVHRMLPEAYDQLLMREWPLNKSFTASQELGKFAELRAIQDGTYRLVLDGGAGAWKSACGFFRLSARAAVPPGSYKGLVRLRWNSAVLYLILSTSPLLSRVSVGHILQARGLPPRPPVLRALDVSVTFGAAGDSCDASCQKQGQYCHAADLLYLNACPVMKKHLGDGSCKECRLGAGPFYPSVSLIADISADIGKGTCIWNANLAEPPTCAASHPSLSRVCACRPIPLAFGMRVATVAPSVAKRKRLEQKDQHQTDGEDEEIPRLTPLQPWSRVDAAVPDQRCGAVYGNRLSPTCERNNHWCCSGEGWCGNTASHCNGPSGRQECTAESSAKEFCGAGWSLRLPQFNLKPPAER